ncbi:DUF2865 domain-containing protein [Pararhizobium polonicum]|nr:DUF2865 domain-containing protein [Pararhizobium polonicum]
MHGIPRRAARIGQMGAMLLVAFVSVTLGGRVEAADCVSNKAGAEMAALQRQIAANRALQVKYSCATGSTFACREIAGRIAQVSTRLASLAASGQSCWKPAVTKRAPPRRAADALPRLAAKIETRCVRLSDGYYFPTPNSGYNTEKDVDVIAAQCRFICDDPAMEVYRMTGEDRNADEMVSVTTGARYADLPRAGVYRDAVPFKACDMARFHKTVLAKMAEARASAQKGASAPTVKRQTVPSADEADAKVVSPVDADFRGMASFAPIPERKVRIVGPPFLPEE